MKKAIIIVLCLAFVFPMALASCGKSVSKGEVVDVAREFVEEDDESQRYFKLKIADLGVKGVSRVDVSFGSYDCTLDENDVYRGTCQGKVSAYDGYGDLIGTYKYSLQLGIPKDRPKAVMASWYGYNGMTLEKVG